MLLGQRRCGLDEFAESGFTGVIWVQDLVLFGSTD